jgi:hypothetical protein
VLAFYFVLFLAFLYLPMILMVLCPGTFGGSRDLASRQPALVGLPFDSVPGSRRGYRHGRSQLTVDRARRRRDRAFRVHAVDGVPPNFRGSSVAFAILLALMTRAFAAPDAALLVVPRHAHVDLKSGRRT